MPATPTPSEAARGRLIIVCGLPAAGKTTHARMLEVRLHAVRFSPDDWMDALGLNLHDEASRARIEALQWGFAERLLALGLVVIIEWGTWARTERDALRLGARARGADVELHYLSAPLDVLVERVTRRARESPPISLEDIRAWAAVFEAPSAEEFALYDAHLVAR